MKKKGGYIDERGVYRSLLPAKPWNTKEMIRARKAPGTKGDDTTFFAGFGTLEDQLGAEQAQMVVEAARAQGYNPSINDVYMPTVARDVGDPMAFFGAGRGRAALKEHIEKNIGTETHGWVDTKAQPRAPVENVDLAPDIVDQIYERESALDPDFARADPNEAKFHIKEHYKKKPAKKPTKKAT